MKITRSRLRQIIKEEVSSAIFEAEPAEEEEGQSGRERRQARRQDRRDRRQDRKDARQSGEEEADAEAEEKDPTHAIFVSGFDMMGMTRIDVHIAEVATGSIVEAEGFNNNIGGAKAHIQDMMKKYPEYVLKVDSESPDVKALEDTKPA